MHASIVLSSVALVSLVACSHGDALSSNSGTNGTTSSAPVAMLAVASDSTGMKLVVVGPDISTSTDRGATWTNRTASGPAHDHAWTAVASDSTGMKLVAVVDGSIDANPNPDLEVWDGDIWTSTDGGVTWTNRTASSGASRQAWFSVASDATGTRLVAATRGQGVLGAGAIWTSSDGGETWVNRTAKAAAQQSWNSVASDSTGMKLVAVGYGIWTSTDAGVTWTDRTFRRLDTGWSSVASDASGQRLVAVVNSGDIWSSTDGGATWIDRTPSGAASQQDWFSVASDSTGTNLVAVDGLVAGIKGDIWSSTDGGLTWTDRTATDPALSDQWVAVASNASGDHPVAVAPTRVWAQ
jgi:photosystem II stability/assembly factor-like uncharacterized protein